MQSALILAACLSGLIAIASDWRGRRRALFYVAKPLTTALILCLAWVALAAWPQHRAWVLAALAACWLGDVALMLPGSSAFVLGLSAFLIGHLLLIAAFLSGLPLAPLTPPRGVLWLAAVFLLLVAGYAAWLLPRTGRLQPAVLLYLIALTAMVLAALLRATVSDGAHAGWVCLGAMLFAVSDAVLAYRKFVHAPWWGQPATLVSYYLAIGLIAWAY